MKTDPIENLRAELSTLRLNLAAHRRGDIALATLEADRRRVREIEAELDRRGFPTL